ncbi:MAG: FkbM family methyltransferase [Ignavibacteria bacterium]|nr:FkbM family methyltransferase [Ignavibacteria bacterium]
MRIHPEYDRNFPLLAKYVCEKYPDGVIVDIGANIGDTIAMLATYGVNNDIIAIEGEINYYRLLLENKKLFKNNIRTFNIFLGEKSEEINAVLDKEKGTAKIIHDKKEKIKLSSFDEFYKNESLENIVLFKSDTDGYDLKVLKGAQDFLNKNKPVIFFEYDEYYFSLHSESGISIFDFLHNCGYKKSIFYDNYGRFIISLDVNSKNQIEQLTRYIKSRKGKIDYYDIALFPEKDLDIYEKLLQELLLQN